MGLRGPSPTAKGILELRGSNRAARRGEEPQPDRRPPRVPTWLPKAGRPIYRETVRQLDAMGILGRCDQNLVARYVQLMLRWLQVEQFLNENGQTYVVRGRGKKNPETGEREPGPVIGVKTYPHVRIARSLASELLRMEDRMGLSPSARARLAGFVNAGAPGGAGDAKDAYFAAG